MADKTPFRVIIVGAGPVGLYLGYALGLANIDYVILERKESVLVNYGSIIYLWPQTVRLFDQPQLLEAVRQAAAGMRNKKRTDGFTGNILTTARFPEFMERRHGYSFLPIVRCDLLRILYHNLPDKETRIKTSSEVVAIKTHSTGVQVHLKTGAVENGSLVIGADGVHSKIRSELELLYKAATGTDANVAPMMANFNGVIGRASNKDLRIEQNVLFETRGTGTVIQCTATEQGEVHFATITPVPDSKPAARQRVTMQDVEDHAASLGHVVVCRGVTFKDLWDNTDKNTVWKLNQEGLLTHWHHDRIALVGDAVHKSTSQNGLGLNLGLHSAASLANELQSLLERDPLPVTSAIDQAFSRYQRTREEEVQFILRMGRKMVRDSASKSWGTWLWTRLMLPWLDIESFGYGIITSLMMIRQGLVLLYVPFIGKQGSMAWKNKPLPAL
ncbi:FAD/NAD(P)-binding domain-containing protein [Aspergillus pseudodeflectus]|uniref:FAD/NAD(P)-binding domain-containing protein n=1 Tax=Aspergillus pseudodeflectus TaxID=176178 RepID=A0ABR4JLY2_9EURO